MWTSIAAGIKALDKILGITEWFQRRAERKEHRRAGKVEQKAADLAARENQASEANEIDEDVRRLSDADLDRELRDG